MVPPWFRLIPRTFSSSSNHVSDWLAVFSAKRKSDTSVGAGRMPALRKATATAKASPLPDTKRRDAEIAKEVSYIESRVRHFGVIWGFGEDGERRKFQI
jgi:hypothetical protein